MSSRYKHLLAFRFCFFLLDIYPPSRPAINIEGQYIIIHLVNIYLLGRQITIIPSGIKNSLFYFISVPSSDELHINT